MATETFIIDIRTRGTKRSAADVKRIGTQATQVRKTLAFLRNALVAVAAVRVFATLTQNLVEFSDQMLVVKAVTGATALEFERLRETAKGLGATTRFTAGEAAEGMAFLARAGFEVNEVISAIPATLDLAAAASLDLGNAADIASNLMTSFGLAVSDLPDIMDTLVFTANNANTTVQQLADGMKLFAPIASQLGISLKEAAAFMGLLGDAGIQASLAGTGFRRVATDLEAPTGNLAKALEIMGIRFEEVRPSLVGMEGALRRLAKANVGASAASLLFGKRGGFVAAQMIRSLDSVAAFRKEMDQIEGTSRRAAEEMEKGLGGALRLVRSALQNLLISFGDLGAEEFLNQFFRDLAEGLRILARNADDVVAAIKVLLAAFVIAKIVSFGGAIFGVVKRLKFLITSLNVVPGAVLRARGALALLTASLLTIPFVAVATAFLGLTTALVLFRDEIKLASDDAGTMADVFTALGDTLGTEITNAVNALGADFSGFGDLVDFISSRVASAIEGIIAVFFGLLRVVKNVFGRISLFFKLFVQGFNTIVTGLKVAINAALDAIGRDPLFENIAADVQGLKEEAALLNKELTETETLFESFIRGGQGFLDTRKEVTVARLINERDAAILATEEANRRAAKARIKTPVEEVDAGRTDLAAALRGGGDADKAAKEIIRLTEALQGLEAAHFPLLAALDAQAEAQKIINDATDKGITLRVNEAELIRRVRREQIGANIVIEQAADEQKVLKKALDDTIISLEEFEFLSRKSAITFLESQRDAASGAQRAFLKLQQDATDAAAFTEMVMTDAFKAIEDAVVDFATTGTISINEFFRNFALQLLRLGVQQAIAGIGSAFPGAGGIGSTGTSGAAAGIGGLAVAAFNAFHEGGAFTVGANSAAASLPGIDNRLIAFRARDGEEVSITPKNQVGQGGGFAGAVTNIVFNVETQNADSFNRSQPQLQNRLLAGIGQAQRRR